MRSILLTILVGLFCVSAVFAFNRERDCKCRSPVKGRIIGGRTADKTSYPWQVSMSLKEDINLPGEFLRRLVPDKIKLGKHSCGGSIINERWILIAAHCLLPKLMGIEIEKFFQIGYSSNDLVEIYNKAWFMEIEKVILHPNFDAVPNERGQEPRRLINDIALIKLKQSLRFSNTVQPACLGMEQKEKYDGLLKISGWGSTKEVLINPTNGESEDVPVPRYLKEADVEDNSATLEICADTKQNVCVDNKKTKDTACKGDSGGPLHYVSGGKSVVVGVASFVDVVPTENNLVRVCTGPTAYARVSSFKDFIETYVQDDYCV